MPKSPLPLGWSILKQMASSFTRAPVTPRPSAISAFVFPSAKDLMRKSLRRPQVLNDRILVWSALALIGVESPKSPLNFLPWPLGLGYPFFPFPWGAAPPSVMSVAPRKECRKKVMYSFTN